VHKQPRAIGEVRSEINVTPLVDVCLVLLIIFMVITPLLARGKEVPLPRTRHHTKTPDSNQPIVAVDDTGRVWFDQDEIGKVVQVEAGAWQVDKPDVLARRIQDAWERNQTQQAAVGKTAEQKVYFKASKDLPYGQVYPVLMAVHEIGIESIDLGTHELKEQAP
jgi:biopolymer transport protein ExbD